MAVSKQVYFDAIGRAGLVFSDFVSDLCALEKAGCVCDWGKALSMCESIECAQFFYRHEDYANSADSTKFYEEMLCIAGTEYSNAMIDPNAQVANAAITGGSEVLEFNFTQDDLIEDGVGTGNWYLPFLDGDGNTFVPGSVPIQLTIDGVGIALQPNYNYSPMRLYGFANNAPQSILLTVLQAKDSGVDFWFIVS